MNMLRTAVQSLVPVLLVSTAVTAYTAEISFTIDAGGLEARGHFAGLKYYDSGKTIASGVKSGAWTNGPAIGLDDMLLIEDDAPGNGPPEGFDAKERAWFEKLSRGIVIKKEIILDAPGAYAAYIVMNGVEQENNDVPLNISVNGTSFVRLPTKTAFPLAEHLYLINENNYFTDNWFVIAIPAGALRKGVNEILLWADSDEPSWEVVVAAEQEFARGSTVRTHHPNRSAKSRDGGKTWDDTRLGWKDALDGEYAIRLSLDRHVPSGTYTSPSIDLGAPHDNCGIKRLVDIAAVTLAWDIAVPAGTSAAVSVSFGTSPVPDADGWTPFEPVKGLSGTWKNPRGRYLRFRVAMSAEDPLNTPLLRGVTVTADVRPSETATNAVIRVLSMKNAVVTRPAVEFVHEDFRAMRGFRERFRLDDVVAGCATEFERQLRLLRFAYEIPIDRFDPYNWDYNNVPVLKTDENGAVFRQIDYTGRRRDKHCLFSNFTLMGACIAMGYPARYVNLQTEGRMHAHEVMEVWSNDFDKWVFMDATRDYYYYDPATGIPLSLTEVNERIAPIVPRTADWNDPIWKQVTDFSAFLKADIGYREGDNKFSVKDVKHGPHLVLMKGQLHQVVRSDFASRPGLVPWRLSGHWAGNQFLGWYSDTFPRKREYGMNTNRSADFNPPLNRSELTLSETETPGVLRVDIDTVTPFFEAFVIRFDDGGPVESASQPIEWPLHEGLNRLRVRARNNAGVMGPESDVTIVLDN